MHWYLTMMNNRLPVGLLQTTVGIYFKLVHTAVTNSNYQKAMDGTLRRAVMYCPGDDVRKVNKGLLSQADCIVLDCEDGVAINQKEAARKSIRNLFDSANLPTWPEVAVRVNAVESGFCEQDLAAILPAVHSPTVLFLPKVESEDSLKWFGEKLDKYLTSNTSVKLFMYAESARAIMDLPDICRSAFNLSKKHGFTPVGLVLGSDDLCASIGSARSVDGAEIIYARQRLVLIAKAFGLQAIDMVHIQYKDLDSLKEQSEAGGRLGFTGKQVIHPSQIDIVQRAFLPSPEQLKWARDIVEGFRLSQEQGKGAFVHDGIMVDMPLLKQAENIIRLSETEPKNKT